MDEVNRWASVALARPVKVQYSRLHTALFAFLMVFFGGLSLLMIVANGFTGTSVLLLVLNGVMLVTLYYILSRARRRCARFRAITGMTRGKP